MRTVCCLAPAVGILASLAAELAPAEPPSQLGLVACWDFDEPSGKVAIDRAGDDNRGTLRGSPAAARVQGPLGSSALHFTAPGQEVSGPDAGLPTGASPGSISLWFRPAPGAANKVLFVYGSPVTGQARGLWLRDAGTLCFFFRNNPPDLYAPIAGGVTPGRWHHVAGTYDGATARLYYDGQLAGQIDTKINTTPSGAFHIGANIDEHTRDYLGLMDDVAVYERALSPEEIRDYYARRSEALRRMEAEQQAKNLERIRGSAQFEVPAMRSLFFVALDEGGLSVKRMQSFVTVQPGETTSCSGCHEQRTLTPSATSALAALRRPPSPIEPFAGIPDVLDFPLDVQPILDRHCVECHNPDRREGDIELCGDHTPVYSSAYWTIVKRRLICDARNGYGNRLPRSIGSSASRLLDYFDGNHFGVRITPQERTTLILWIETGATYPGTYASYLSGIAPVNFPLETMARRCGRCHGVEPNSHPRLPWEGDDIRPWARLPFKFGDADPALSLSNLARPEKSYLLLAPLACGAGGYGLCAEEFFTSTADPDYQAMLQSIVDAKALLERIKRFDMPGFRPKEHYFREMKHFGIIPADQKPEDPIDVYATDQAFWASAWLRR